MIHHKRPKMLPFFLAPPRLLSWLLWMPEYEEEIICIALVLVQRPPYDWHQQVTRKPPTCTRKKKKTDVFDPDAWVLALIPAAARHGERLSLK